MMYRPMAELYMLNNIGILKNWKKKKKKCILKTDTAQQRAAVAERVTQALKIELDIGHILLVILWNIGSLVFLCS